MLRRERVQLRHRVVVDDAGGHHRTEPLADVPFLEASPAGKFVARRRASRGGGEQAGAVAELDHVGHKAADVVAEQLLGKGFRLALVECGGHRCGPPQSMNPSGSRSSKICPSISYVVGATK